MNKILYFGLVIGAAAAGAVAAWYLTKDNEHKRADEEISEMREYYAHKCDSNNTPKAKKEAPVDKTSENKKKSKEMRDYQNIVRQNYKKKREEEPKKPFVISPDDFGENPGYDRLSLTMYADNVVADENDDIVEDVEDCIGFANLSHIGDYEADILHIQNDKLHIYYEITRDLRSYADVAGERPRRLEVT